MGNSECKDELLLQFVDEKVLKAFNAIASKEDAVPQAEDILAVTEIFCLGNGKDCGSFIIDATKSESEERLTQSFHKNLKLLVEKTWVEASDVTVKDQVLYRIDKLCDKLSAGDYANCYRDFISVLLDVVYLMFGSQAKKEDFAEYALRIDPEFGIFWWYLHSLPRERTWTNDKCRVVILLGMYFLSNY